MRAGRTVSHAARIGLSVVAVGVISVGLGFGRAWAQQPVFRTETRLIVETVTVKDKEGRAIEGLTAKDFSITEDGEPQEIAFVEFQRLDASTFAPSSQTASLDNPNAPGAPSAPGTPAPNVLQTQISASAPGDIRYRDKRLIVLYFDMTTMGGADQMRALGAAQRFIGSMDDSVLMAIMSFQGGAVRVRTDFTADRARLEEQVLRLIYGDDLDGDGFPDTPEQGTAFGQDDYEFNVFNTDRQLAALQTAMGMLRPLPERKALVYFSSGLRLNGTDNNAQLRATTNAALRANVSIHAIDARGLIAMPPLGDASRPSPGGMQMFTGQGAMSLTSGLQRSQDTLYALSKDTGGNPMFDYNDLALGITRAAESMTSYYIIGYYSTHTAADGRFRRVRVSLTNGMSADVQYRSGYFADKTWAKLSNADRERQLEEALMLDNPITDITIAIEVNYFQLNRAEYFVPVGVKIPGSELVLAQRGGAARTVIDFIGEVKDDYGITIQNVRDKLDIRLNAETASQLARRPIQYETGFTLLPGKYVIKMLARDAETGRIGTFQAAFSIPNLNREEKRIPISSVVLSSQRVPMSEAIYSVRQKLPADAVNPLVFNGEKLIPSVTRVFTKARDFHVFLQAYQRAAETTQPLVASVSFFRDGTKVYETAPQAVVEGLNPKTKAVPLQFTVSLEGFPTGRYECQVSVLDPTGVKATFWRAPIVIIP
jgi:VWFA-related protein